MSIVQVYYASFSEPFLPDVYAAYLRQLPVALQQDNQRFRRWQDRHANLIGKTLLRQVLAPYTTPYSPLDKLAYTAYKRPFIPGAADFNLSHSGEYVVLAVGGNGLSVGVDIEKIRPVELSDFRSVMTPRQWQQIQQASDPLQQFYTYWAMKESIIKAVGKGLSIPLDELEFQSDTTIVYESHTYWMTPLSIDKAYPCFLTTSDPVSTLHIQPVQL